jgi:hypothetical protein
MLSSGVLSKKTFHTNHLWLLRPKPEFGAQNTAAVMQGVYLNPQLKVPSVTAGTAGNVIDLYTLTPPPPTELGVVGGDCCKARRNKSCKNEVCTFVIYQPHRHLSSFSM